MLRGITKRAKIDTHPDDAIGTLTEKLPATYKPTIRPLVKHQSELFGVPESAFKGRDSDEYSRPGYEEILDAEIYTFGSVLIVVGTYKATRIRHSRNEDGELVSTEEESNSLVITYAVPSSEEPDMTEFERLVSEVWPGIELSEIRPSSRRLRELDNGKPNPAEIPTLEEEEAAEILSDKPLRMLAIAIKSSRGLLLGDASKQIPPTERGRIDDLVDKLIDNGLIQTEIVVICAKTSTQINLVPSAEAFEHLDKAGVRCSCGRPLSAEKQEKALTITEFGRTMLDGNRWMSILVLRYLIKLGIPVVNVRMEQIYSGEEVDCIAEIHGQIILFELKDKEFNRGNAYSFGAKIGIFQPDVSVVITTERVGADARDHFMARSAGSTRARRPYRNSPESEGVTFIEGLVNLERGLDAVVTEVVKSALAPKFRSALSFSNPVALALLSAWAGEGDASNGSPRASELGKS
ncbi:MULTISPECIES: hypothetical protein [unclassified Streptomyces]|uniref:hypothetical protein n=1 Tax=unclassified Streptomyces TaxID=2593676 RepID=UPI00331DA344